jgi:hypothetical protein
MLRLLLLPVGGPGRAFYLSSCGVLLGMTEPSVVAFIRLKSRKIWQTRANVNTAKGDEIQFVGQCKLVSSGRHYSMEIAMEVIVIKFKCFFVEQF